MSTGVKVAIGIGAAAAVGGAFWYVMKQRQAMLSSALNTAPLPIGTTMGYTTAGQNIVSGMVVPSIQTIMNQPLSALQAAGATTAPVSEARSGRGHF